MSLSTRRQFKYLKSRLDRLRKARGEGIQQHEHRVYSQHREDGIIQHLLSCVRNPSPRFIEFGFGPLQGNCHNLLFHHQFSGLFMDGSASKCDLMKELLGSDFPESRVVNLFIDRDNLNDAVKTHGFASDIGVLSIDVDGNDFWFWQCLTCIDPQIVVIEYNASLGTDRSVTVPYDPGFVRYDKHPSGLYHGASLCALTELGREKGYALVGVDSTGVNAFFVKKEFVSDDLKEKKPSAVFVPHRGRTKYSKISESEQWSAVKDMPFIEI